MVVQYKLEVHVDFLSVYTLSLLSWWVAAAPEAFGVSAPGFVPSPLRGWAPRKKGFFDGSLVLQGKVDLTAFTWSRNSFDSLAKLPPKRCGAASIKFSSPFTKDRSVLFIEVTIFSLLRRDILVFVSLKHFPVISRSHATLHYSHMKPLVRWKPCPLAQLNVYA